MINNKVKTTLLFSEDHCPRLLGVLYAGKYSQPKKALIIIHGACSNILTGPSFFIPNNLEDTDYDIICINLTSSNLGYIDRSYNYKGWSWQSRKRNIREINELINELKKIGYKEISICAHSWGALITLDYLLFNKYAGIKHLIFLSPVFSYRLLLEVNYGDNLPEVINYVENNHLKNPKEIILTKEWAKIPFFSSETIHDFLSDDIDLIKYVKNNDHSFSFIVGENEHSLLKSGLEDLQKTNRNITTTIVEKANHFYKNKEKIVSLMVDQIMKEGKNEIS